MKWKLFLIIMALALICAIMPAGAAESPGYQNGTDYQGTLPTKIENSSPVQPGDIVEYINNTELAPLPLLEVDPTTKDTAVPGDGLDPAVVKEGKKLTQWMRCIGGTNIDYGYSIQQTADGGYVFTGVTYSTDGDMIGSTGYHGGGDAFVAKLNSAGTIDWVRCVGGSGTDYGTFIRQTSDGGYILAGFTYSSSGDMTGAGNHGAIDSFAAKLTAAGSVQWVKCVGGTNEDEGYSVEQTTDGGYILAGYTYSSDGDMGGPAGYHGGRDAFMAKLSSTGVVIWVECVGGTGSDKSDSIRQNSNGDYVLAGTTLSSDGDMVNAGYHGGTFTGDAFVAVLNPAGRVQWVKCIGGTKDDSGYSIQQTPDGGYYLAGDSVSQDGDMVNSGNHMTADAFAAKLNSAGTAQWVRCIGGTSVESANSVNQTMDGGCVISGYTYSTDGDMKGAGNHGGQESFAAKLSSAGIVQWVRCVGGTNSDYSYSVQQTPDSGYLLSGYTSSSDGDMASPAGYQGNYDAFATKFFVPGVMGVYSNGQWYMDTNGDTFWNGQPPDRTTSFGIPGDIPVIGDWDRDSASEIGVFRGGLWYVDYDGHSYLWDGNDRVFNFGFSGATPVMGDWNGDTKPEIGVYHAGIWYLDANANNTWDGTGTGKDAMYSFGVAGWTPVVGDWNRDGQVEIGVYTGGTWYADANRNYGWDGTGTGKDAILNFGFAGAVPVTGDWNNDGKLEIGVYNAGTWYLDANGNNTWDGTGAGKDVAYTFGAAGFAPVVGEWS
jgi:hypothetical protein